MIGPDAIARLSVGRTDQPRLHQLMLDSLVFALLLIIVGYVARLLVRPPDKNLCPHCGYNLSGHARPAICPECGLAEETSIRATAESNKAHG